MFRTGSPEESRMLLRELSDTALLLLFSLDCGPTTITTSSEDTSDCLVGVAYGLGGGEGKGPDTLQSAHTSDSLMASYLEAATGSPVSW